MNGAARDLATLLRWLGGPVAWAAQFLILYASESLFCRAGSPSAHLVLGAAVSLAAALAALWAILANRQRRDGAAGYVFMDQVGLALGVFGLVAIAWTALPLAILPACSSFPALG